MESVKGKRNIQKEHRERRKEKKWNVKKKMEISIRYDVMLCSSISEMANGGGVLIGRSSAREGIQHP
ncbi:hypothetical protein NQ314_012515 [Rhamnusium bicolor]|uniref:Ribosomal protein S14 n=1 Tax=Rhamnusium bicolor TaxID=1586634 RepID=A0AAV8XC80_9CUCU|nr:hypothetical protein NQ314_012515 [Rhamnusium bicolor]